VKNYISKIPFIATILIFNNIALGDLQQKQYYEFIGHTKSPISIPKLNPAEEQENIKNLYK